MTLNVPQHYFSICVTVSLISISGETKYIRSTPPPAFSLFCPNELQNVCSFSHIRREPLGIDQAVEIFCSLREGSESKLSLRFCATFIYYSTNTVSKASPSWKR